MSQDTTYNPHERVSPEPEQDEVTSDELSDAPETGEQGEVASVEGMQIEPVAAALAEAFAAEEVAPDTSGLRPVGEATYGTPDASTESVHGPDNRIQITSTAVYPWRAHCSLLITANDGSRWIGTGWFNGPRTVITAGHCVFIHAPGTPRHGWVRSVEVMPGRNGATLPYGKVTVPRSGLRSVVGWVNGPDDEYDYAALILPTPLGSTTGWFGFGNFSDSTLRSAAVNLSGYPGDKPSGTQWYHWSSVTAVSARKVYYTLDTAGGQSGSAVYIIRDNGRYAVGVHAYGGASSNSATRINKPVFDNLKFWKG